MSRWALLLGFAVLATFNSCEEIVQDWAAFEESRVRCLAMPVPTFTVEVRFSGPPPEAVEVSVPGWATLNTCDHPELSVGTDTITMQYIDVDVPSSVDVKIVSWASCVQRTVTSILVQQTQVPVPMSTSRICDVEASSGRLSYLIPD